MSQSMPCPNCGHTESTVESVYHRQDNTNTRRRECEECGYRWTTREVIQVLDFGDFCFHCGGRVLVVKEKLVCSGCRRIQEGCCE